MPSVSGSPYERLSQEQPRRGYTTYIELLDALRGLREESLLTALQAADTEAHHHHCQNSEPLSLRVVATVSVGMSVITPSIEYVRTYENSTSTWSLSVAPTATSTPSPNWWQQKSAKLKNGAQIRRQQRCDRSHHGHGPEVTTDMDLNTSHGPTERDLCISMGL